MQARPKVTVGLLVYNEAAHVREALDAILGQTFTDYEILVGDNCSTDGTTEIVAEYASRDGRIRHLVHDRNIGALQNWNAIVRAAAGEYFVLAGGHDLWTPDYLDLLTRGLEGNPDAVLAFAKTQWIDERGIPLEKPTDAIDTSGMRHQQRFMAVMITNQHYLYGLIRLSALRRTRLQKEIIGSGEILLQELAALGSFLLVEGPRWFRRENRKPETVLEKLERYERMLFSSPRMRLRFRFFPLTQMFFCYLALPFQLPAVDWKQRLSMLALYPYLCLRFGLSLPVDLKWLVHRFLR
ncbi:MAG: glycosyltransferase family 2 protein [Pseudohaliea sp.]